VLSVRQVLAAAFRAINDRANGRMKSRNVHSETVFALSPNNNVSTPLQPVVGIASYAGPVLFHYGQHLIHQGVK
jgi:hypothetical protein